MQRLSNFLKEFKLNTEIVFLRLDEKALQRLNKEKENRNTDLFLEIKIMREDSGRGAVHIGFSPVDAEHLIHPIFGHFISESDFQSLACGEISYDESEGRYIYYPNIDLVWEDTPRGSIKRISANKTFTNVNRIWTSQEKAPFEPLQKIIELKEVISCYAEGKCFQIEFSKVTIDPKLEEEISELILTYFSYLYPPLA